MTAFPARQTRQLCDVVTAAVVVDTVADDFV